MSDYRHLNGSDPVLFIASLLLFRYESKWVVHTKKSKLLVRMTNRIGILSLKLPMQQLRLRIQVQLILKRSFKDQLPFFQHQNIDKDEKITIKMPLE